MEIQKSIERFTATHDAEEKLHHNVVCADRFTMSVIAGPRTMSIAGTHVEVGFPKERPEPWAVWEGLCQDTSAPTKTVYAYVPFQTVLDLIALHGGEVIRVPKKGTLTALTAHR
jgi:hypothetical protein